MQAMEARRYVPGQGFTGRSLAAESTLVLTEREVCLELEHDLPVLRIWCPETERVVVEWPLSDLAAEKLGAQGLAVADANRWRETKRALHPWQFALALWRWLWRAA